MADQNDKRRQEAVDKLRAIVAKQTGTAGFSNIEDEHGEADRILCNLLTDLGYADVVAEWEKIEKWYA